MHMPIHMDMDMDMDMDMHTHMYMHMHITCLRFDSATPPYEIFLHL